MSLDEINRHDGAAEHRDEHDLYEVSKLLLSGERADEEKVIEFMRSNPDKISDIVQALVDDCGNESPIIAAKLVSLLEIALRK